MPVTLIAATNAFQVAGWNETGGDLYVLSFLYFAASSFPVGALVIIVPSVVRCVFVWRIKENGVGGCKCA